MTQSQDLLFTVVVSVEEDKGRFYVSCPALKGLYVDGATADEALQNAKLAVTAYLLSLRKHGEAIPVGIETHAPAAHPSFRSWPVSRKPTETHSLAISL